jgi:GTP cyclohydrolase I
MTQQQTDISIEAQKVRDALIKKGLETPIIDNKLTNDQKYTKIKSLMAEVMETLGLDLTDDSLEETPHRIAKMYVNEIFSGLDYAQFPQMSLIDNSMRVDEMVKIHDINLTSTCEHHFIVIDGMAKVAYIPEDKIIGLSKINRIVHFFAQRPQVQERLNQQILVALQTLLNTENVAVSINASHFCVKARGIRDVNSFTETNALGGIFKTNPHTRNEYLQAPMAR